MVGITTFILSFGIAGSKTRTSVIQTTIEEALVQKYSGAITQQEKINLLFDYTMAQLKLNMNKNIIGEFNLNKFLTLQTLFIVAPILIIVAIYIYIYIKCYPYSNFLWGDYEEYYSKLTSRRKTLWNLVFGSIILSIIVNLFVLGLSGYLKLW